MDPIRRLSVDGAEIIVLPDEDAVSGAAAEVTVATLQAALDERDAAHLVLTGGSSAVALYSLMAEEGWRERLADWSHVHLWWGDERLVPPDHPESNVGLAYRSLLAWGPRTDQSSGGTGTDVSAGVTAGLPIPPDNVHAPQIVEALRTDDPGKATAEAYLAMIRKYAPMGVDGNPEFDVVHLGIGPDGHMMSIFPGSSGLAPDAPLAMAIDAPTHVGPHIPRVTLTPRILASGAPDHRDVCWLGEVWRYRPDSGPGSRARALACAAGVATKRGVADRRGGRRGAAGLGDRQTDGRATRK